MKLIPLTRGKFAQVDNGDFQWLNQWKWHAAEKKKGTGIWYAKRSVGPRGNYTWIRMHRLVVGVEDESILVDHKDGDGLNNQRSNLRIATGSQNNMNRRVNVRNAIGLKGVSWCEPAKKWRARIKLNGKEKHLGVYDDMWIAAAAYDFAAKQMFGDFARPNAVCH